jgi:pimeloyl-ACP methyl ester carboxylesterase
MAELILDDYVAHTMQIVRRVADHGPVVLVGHSMGGSTVAGVANSAPELVARLVYLCAYCCIESPSLPAYAPHPDTAADVLARAREVV